MKAACQCLTVVGDTHACKFLGRWPASCLTLDKLLTLSEPPCPPQLTRRWKGQRRGWLGQAGSVYTLKVWAPPRAKPAAKSGS